MSQPVTAGTATPRCGVAVMAKASIPGRTKTRLVPPLSFDQAAALNTAFLKDVSANLLCAAERASLAGYMAYGPIGSERFFHDILPAGIGRFECWLPDFGDCLFGAISKLLDRGHQSAVVLNSDSPTLPTSFLADAAEILARPGDRAVLGPSDDGGYYLLGLKARHRGLFERVAWSTEHVAQQTLARAAEIGLEVHLLPTWYDIDDIASLRMFEARRFERRALASRLQPHPAPHAERLVRELIARVDAVKPRRPSSQDVLQGAAE
jgi:rSAM/selenodomain-associated transferase 1